jgi:galactose mutarotase-like enzyme
MHGLILSTKSDSVNTENTADGQTVTGVIHAADFGGHWPSNTDLTVTISLTGGAVDATITAKNVGNDPEPMALGWHPYFAIPSGDRKLLPVKTAEAGKWDFNAADGKPLGDVFLDDNFAKLKRTDGQVVVSLTDPAYGYGIHIEGISPEIKTVQVYAPPAKQFTAIEEQYNFGDPFAKAVWKGMDTGMVTLKPGESTTWHVRLELFTPGK